MTNCLHQPCLGSLKLSLSTYAKEMLAIIQVIWASRPYLLGCKFYIQTDQQRLKYLLKQRIATAEQQKWVSKLLKYDYEILYKLGQENAIVDALSQITSGSRLDTLYACNSQIWDTIKDETTTYPYKQKIGTQADSQLGEPYKKTQWLDLL